LLEKFDRATQHLSMARHPTISSVIPMYDWLRTELKKFVEAKKTDTGSLALAASKALEKLTQYKPEVLDSAVLYLAVVLRPSLKLNYFKEYPSIYDSRTQKQVKALAIETFENYYETTEVPTDAGNDGDDLDNDFYQHMSKRSRKSKAQSEMLTYLAAQLAPPKTNTLEWWKVHATEFPDVAKMAMDIFAAQATSVPVEREFSGGVDLIVPTRNRLSPSTITASMCLKSWWRNN
jgi:hAT family C-terminal dimerisation region